MKHKVVRFRCTTYEQKLLKVKARKTGLSLSEYCRRATFDDKIVERLTEEQIELYQTLVKYKINFKRIANMFKKHNPKLANEVLRLAEEIQIHLNSFAK